MHHPAIEEISVEGILHALSDPARAQIFRTIAGCNETQTCSAFLSSTDRVLPKSTLSQHFKVLREAGLIRSERRGVELHSSSRCEEINRRFPGLLPAITAAFTEQKKRSAPRTARSR